MDIVASPVSSDEPSDRYPDPSSQPHADDLHNTQYVTTQETADEPSELQKPPLLKHVYVDRTIPYDCPI